MDRRRDHVRDPARHLIFIDISEKFQGTFKTSKLPFDTFGSQQNFVPNGSWHDVTAESMDFDLMTRVGESGSGRIERPSADEGGIRGAQHATNRRFRGLFGSPAGGRHDAIHAQVLHDLAVMVPGVTKRIHNQSWPGAVKSDDVVFVFFTDRCRSSMKVGK